MVPSDERYQRPFLPHWTVATRPHKNYSTTGPPNHGHLFCWRPNAAESDHSYSAHWYPRRYAVKFAPLPDNSKSRRYAAVSGPHLSAHSHLHPFWWVPMKNTAQWAYWTQRSEKWKRVNFQSINQSTVDKSILHTSANQSINVFRLPSKHPYDCCKRRDAGQNTRPANRGNEPVVDRHPTFCRVVSDDSSPRRTKSAHWRRQSWADPHPHPRFLPLRLRPRESCCSSASPEASGILHFREKGQDHRPCPWRER